MQCIFYMQIYITRYSLLDLIVCIDLEKLSDGATCEMIKFEYDKEILDHVIIRDTNVLVDIFPTV